MLQPGQTFASRYLVRRCIAEGGMGAIFEAEHVATERRVALKLLFPHIMSVASARQKFELEAKISARVNSPYIVEVLDAGFDEASKSPYLVMELLEGQTLAARVREQGPLAPDEALRLLEQVAAGLDAAHGYKEASGASKPIVHRDLKPENLFLARQHDGSVIAKILDYGIAKVLGDTTHISQEVRGTPLFMAFEQITAGVLSPQTDVWALGLIAYHVLTGARYWRSAERQGANVQSLFAEILTLPLEAPSLRLREQNPDMLLPPAFDAWFLRCIDREPAQRFPSAGAAIEALARVYERAPRAAAVPSIPVARAPDKTQTFIAAPAAAPAAAPPPGPPAPAAAVGSVPALSATEHRRSFPSSVMTSPLHWAAVGALGGVLVLGGVWFFTRDARSSAEAPAVASQPSSSVQAARPAPPSPAPPASAPRIRVAPLDETATAQRPSAGLPEAAASDRGAANPALDVGLAPAAVMSREAGVGEPRAGFEERATAAAAPSRDAAQAPRAAPATPRVRPAGGSRPMAPPSGGAPVLASPSSPPGDDEGPAPASSPEPARDMAPPHAARQRRSPRAGSSEAYKTR